MIKIRNYIYKTFLAASLAGILSTCSSEELRGIPRNDFPEPHEQCVNYVNTRVKNTVATRRLNDLPENLELECDKLLEQVLLEYETCIANVAEIELSDCFYASANSPDVPLDSRVSRINCIKSAFSEALVSDTFDVAKDMEISCLYKK